MKIQLRRFLLEREEGTAIIEFTLVLPILVLLLAMAIDFGAVLHTRFRLNAAMSAGANYAIVHGKRANQLEAVDLARDIATLVGNNQGPDWANVSSLVNNGPLVVRDTHGTTESGSAAHIQDCYCLAAYAAAPVWGGAGSCGEECPSGGYAGRFVLIEASRAHNPVFSNYGMVSDGRLSAHALVQIQ